MKKIIPAILSICLIFAFSSIAISFNTKVQAEEYTKTCGRFTEDDLSTLDLNKYTALEGTISSGSYESDNGTLKLNLQNKSANFFSGRVGLGEYNSVDILNGDIEITAEFYGLQSESVDYKNLKYGIELVPYIDKMLDYTNSKKVYLERVNESLVNLVVSYKTDNVETVTYKTELALDLNTPILLNAESYDSETSFYYATNNTFFPILDTFYNDTNIYGITLFAEVYVNDNIIDNAVHVGSLEYDCYRQQLNTEPLPVHRLYNIRTGETHFYTIDTDEKDFVLDNSLPTGLWPDTFIEEEPTFQAFKYNQVDEVCEGVGTRPVYRFLNTRTGNTHFYGIDPVEIKTVKTLFSDTFELEEVGFCAFTYETDGYTVPVHRWQNLSYGDTHFYSASESEYDYVTNNLKDSFKYEGIGFYALPIE